MILLTGATGYIGSHVWVELLKGSIPVIGIDNLSNSKIDCLDAILKISGKTPSFYKGDVRDESFLQKVFSENKISHVIHLAALKGVQESMTLENEYFDVNVQGLRNLLVAMRRGGCQNIIFSSSAAVYGELATSPIMESAATNPSNYYGKTKLEGEKMLASERLDSPPINSVSLRYFNVAGRDVSGLLPDFSLVNSRSLFSEIEKSLRCDLTSLSVFGDDWDTPDGTCIRDYVHITDLVEGHLAALRFLDNQGGIHAVNLGSGVGRSVYEVVSSYKHATGIDIPLKVVGRREGDVAVSFADVALAAKLFGWKPKKALSEICSDDFRALKLP